MTGWHILTPELPPACGGVGEYTAQLAISLAQAGDGPVTVWTPGDSALWDGGAGVEVQRLPDRFGPRSTGAIDARLASDGTARLLVQYVPNVLGAHGANLAFCRWLRRCRDRGRDVRVMFHEPYLYLRWRPDHLAVAIAQRWMAAATLRAATHVYVSTSTWRRYLAPFGRAGAEAVELPIPSAIPCVADPGAVAARRAALGARTIVGHFGTYGSHVAPLVAGALRAILAREPEVMAICAGDRGDRFVAELVRSQPSLAGRVHGPGRLAAREISIDLQACDLLLQPYPDGVTTRRTSLMAGLANGCAILTTDGRLTESIWRASGAVACAPAGDAAAFVDQAIRLLHDAEQRRALASRARATYTQRFDMAHTVAALTAPERAHA